MKKLLLGLTLIAAFVAGAILATSSPGVVRAQSTDNGTSHGDADKNHAGFTHAESTHDGSDEGHWGVRIGDQHSELWGNESNITASIDNINDGVRITLTSDNPDTVTLLQERFGSGRGPSGGYGRHGSELIPRKIPFHPDKCTA